MTPSLPTDGFLSGVIEGFYGPPWTNVERLELFDRMATWGLNTYFYAPKDDLKQRTLWRELYSQAEAGELKALVEACAARGLHFIYGLSPGLDIRYADESDLRQIRQRFEQMLALGCREFALLFDDIPGTPRRHRSLAVGLAGVGTVSCRQRHPHVDSRARARRSFVVLSHGVLRAHGAGGSGRPGLPGHRGP